MRTKNWFWFYHVYFFSFSGHLTMRGMVAGGVQWSALSAAQSSHQAPQPPSGILASALQDTIRPHSQKMIPSQFTVLLTPTYAFVSTRLLNCNNSRIIYSNSTSQPPHCGYVPWCLLNSPPRLRCSSLTNVLCIFISVMHCGISPQLLLILPKLRKKSRPPTKQVVLLQLKATIQMPIVSTFTLLLPSLVQKLLLAWLLLYIHLQRFQKSCLFKIVAYFVSLPIYVLPPICALSAFGACHLAQALAQIWSQRSRY